MTSLRCLSNMPAMTLSGLCVLLSYGSTRLVADDGDCGVPPGMTDYVGKSRELVAEGVPLEEVLDVLACLARPISDTQGLAPRQIAPARRGGRRDGKAVMNPEELARIVRVIQSPRAVRAIFQLCDSEVCTRRYLLEIVADPATSFRTNEVACEWLPYVADNEVAARLLSLAKAAWTRSSKFAGYAKALQDIGSSEFLQWLEATAQKGLDDGTLVSQQVAHLRMRAEYIRIQEDPDRILNYLSSFDGSIDPGWAVHQACRHGISRDRIRSAVLSGLANGKEDKRRIIHFEPLLSDCHAMGVLTAEEVSGFRVFPLNSLPRREKKRPHWADSKLEAKRRAFWRIDRLSEGSGQ